MSATLPTGSDELLDRVFAKLLSSPVAVTQVDDSFAHAVVSVYSSEFWA
jgi:hypothetical protein